MVVGIAQKEDLVFMVYKPGIWRALLWHKGKYLSNKEIYRRDAMAVNGVLINNVPISRVNTLEALSDDSTIGRRTGIWVQQDNWLYVRLRSPSEEGASCSSQDWMFISKSRVIWQNYTNKEFNVVNGEQIKHAVVSKYKMKQSAELDDFSTFKFNTVKIDILTKFIGTDFKAILGQLVRVTSDDLSTSYESQYIEDISYDENVVTLSCKDIRSRLSDMVINQQYDSTRYRNTGGNIVMDKDVGKRYMADAVGYCVGVPGDCINGYAHNSEPYRKYRFSYGELEVDYQWDNTGSLSIRKGVEVEVENGWRVLKKSYSGLEEPGCYWTVPLKESLPDGSTLETTLICVPLLVAHPPKEGFTQADAEATPRKLRVTGWFHTEIYPLERDRITQPFEVMKYIIDRYSLLPFEDATFDTAAIAAELSSIADAKIGIYLNKPEKLFNVLGKLQSGCMYGFQLYKDGDLVSARVNNPNREPWGEIKYTDIMNIKSLKPSVDGKNYASSISILYGRNCTEDTYTEYIDDLEETHIVNLRGVQRRKAIETLLKDIDGAMKRAKNELDYSRNISHLITGVSLRPPMQNPQKFYALKIYDIVAIDFGSLIKSKTGLWMVKDIEIDVDTNVVTISVKEKV